MTDYDLRKKAMVDRINELYGLDLRFKADDKTKKVSQDDTADGIAVGRAWLLQHRPELL